MFTSKSKLHISHAISNQQVADEIESRLDLGAYTAYKLDLAKMKLWLGSALSDAVLGDLLADKFKGAEDALIAQATGEVPEVPAVAAQFDGQVAGMTTDVTIDADVAGAAGNITLVADSIDDIDDLILAHNTAFPANAITLSAGDGSQVPTANIELAGGADLVPASNPDLVAKKAAFDSSSLPDNFLKVAGPAFADEEAAQEFLDLHDDMVAAVAALT